MVMPPPAVFGDRGSESRRRVVLPARAVVAVDAAHRVAGAAASVARMGVVPGAQFGVSEDRIARAQRFALELGVPLTVDGRLGSQTKRFVRTFQDAYQIGGVRLVVDGLPGGKTEQAMDQCRTAGFLLSKNFGARAFLTKGERRVTSQNAVWLVTREHVAALQRLRDLIGQPLYLLSTYRDPVHNKKIGGATNSQHIYGLASDIDRPRTGREITEAEARRCGFNGIGMEKRSQPGRHVIHVDVRPSPARWFYT